MFNKFKSRDIIRNVMVNFFLLILEFALRHFLLTLSPQIAV